MFARKLLQEQLHEVDELKDPNVMVTGEDLVGQFHMFCCHGCGWILPSKALFFFDRVIEIGIVGDTDFSELLGPRTLKVLCPTMLPATVSSQF